MPQPAVKIENMIYNQCVGCIMVRRILRLGILPASAILEEILVLTRLFINNR